jgi:hypothetical protein
VLTNYLPGKTFDFEKVATISRVTDIRGVQKDKDLDLSVMLPTIADDARAWLPDYRKILRDDVLVDPSRFVLLDPNSVQAEMFPKVFWCQNPRCNRVFDYGHSERLPERICSACKTGRLAQLRFVQIHQCGAIEPLIPPRCDRCHKNNKMALDTRGSERISNFRWVCRGCGERKGVFGWYCQHCSWPDGGSDAKRMKPVVHRTGSAFYAHTATLLNIPDKRLGTFFDEVSDWQSVAAAVFLGIPEVQGRKLTEFVEDSARVGSKPDDGLSGADLEEIMADAASLTGEELAARMKALKNRRQEERASSSASGIAEALRKRTGVSVASWRTAGQEMLEAVMPQESGNPQDLLPIEGATEFPEAAGSARRMGVANLSLIEDFPMVTATYGFSRVDYKPNRCWLNPFPPKREHDGKYPIFVDQVQADAILFRLDASRVVRWLERNGQTVDLPNGERRYAEPAFFVELFDDAPLRQTLKEDRALTRMVFGLLHTVCHLFVKNAAVLCGMERNSLAEYVLPRALSAAVYCNHRSGATIGALTALYEQSLAEWLDAVRDARRCVYDPVCKWREGSCHACTHLAETSCSYFNLNLGRTFLFGGRDPQLGELPVGFFDPSLENKGDVERA